MNRLRNLFIMLQIDRENCNVLIFIHVQTGTKVIYFHNRVFYVVF